MVTVHLMVPSLKKLCKELVNTNEVQLIDVNNVGLNLDEHNLAYEMNISKEIEKANEEGKKLYNYLHEEIIAANKVLSFKLPENEEAKKFDSMIADAKKQMLDAMLKSAQILSPHQYTKKSWRNFIGLMKDAMRLAGGGNNDLAKITRAMVVLNRAYASLRFAPKRVMSNLRVHRPIPKSMYGGKSLENTDTVKETKERLNILSRATDDITIKESATTSADTSLVLEESTALTTLEKVASVDVAL